MMCVTAKTDELMRMCEVLAAAEVDNGDADSVNGNASDGTVGGGGGDNGGGSERDGDGAGSESTASQENVLMARARIPLLKHAAAREHLSKAVSFRKKLDTWVVKKLSKWDSSSQFRKARKDEGIRTREA
jgi:hypothetical protein